MMIVPVLGKENIFKMRFILCFSSRPGRPPKRNPSYQTNDYPEDKRLKFASNLFRRVYPNHLNQLSLFNSSAFIPTLPQLYPTNNNQTSTSSSKSEYGYQNLFEYQTD